MRCLYFYLIGFLLLLFVSCECQQTKEASSICHFVEEYRNMYYNELSPTDSMFFAALIEENDGVSSLFLIGTKDVIPSFVQRPPLPDSIGEFCELIDPIDSVESSGIPKDISVNSDSTTNLTVGITVNGVASADKTLSDLNFSPLTTEEIEEILV